MPAKQPSALSANVTPDIGRVAVKVKQSQCPNACRDLDGWREFREGSRDESKTEQNVEGTFV